MEEPQEKYKVGYVSLFRSFIDWEWFNSPNMITVFIYCLLKANFKNKSWRGINIERGSFITSVKTISKDTNLTTQQVRTCLKKLKKTEEINIQTNKQNTLVTICKYNDYQSNEATPNKQPNKRVTNEQQTSNKQLTTTNNDNKENKEINTINANKKTIEKDFMVWFNKKRAITIGKPSKLKDLTDTDKRNLHKLRKVYDGDDFVTAYRGMEKNDWALENNAIHPTHFLVNNNFNRYFAKGQEMQGDKNLKDLSPEERLRRVNKAQHKS